MVKGCRAALERCWNEIVIFCACNSDPAQGVAVVRTAAADGKAVVTNKRPQSAPVKATNEQKGAKEIKRHDSAPAITGKPIQKLFEHRSFNRASCSEPVSHRIQDKSSRSERFSPRTKDDTPYAVYTVVDSLPSAPEPQSFSPQSQSTSGNKVYPATDFHVDLPGTVPAVPDLNFFGNLSARRVSSENAVPVAPRPSGDDEGDKVRAEALAVLQKYDLDEEEVPVQGPRI